MLDEFEAATADADRPPAAGADLQARGRPGDPPPVRRPVRPRRRCCRCCPAALPDRLVASASTATTSARPTGSPRFRGRLRRLQHRRRPGPAPGPHARSRSRRVRVPDAPPELAVQGARTSSRPRPAGSTWGCPCRSWTPPAPARTSAGRRATTRAPPCASSSTGCASRPAWTRRRCAPAPAAPARPRAPHRPRPEALLERSCSWRRPRPKLATKDFDAFYAAW